MSSWIGSAGTPLTTHLPRGVSLVDAQSSDHYTLAHDDIPGDDYC